MPVLVELKLALSGEGLGKVLFGHCKETVHAGIRIQRKRKTASVLNKIFHNLSINAHRRKVSIQSVVHCTICKGLGEPPIEKLRFVKGHVTDRGIIGSTNGGSDVDISEEFVVMEEEERIGNVVDLRIRRDKRHVIHLRSLNLGVSIVKVQD
jgi:hypothetical protein